ncbi:SymE family type I addiction module toxin [Frischella sp. Ac48]|uniref:SymE family type I addiction module toxin n=1 Tax=Frischella sp. Ac48 TaxID=2804531 RepID=UPI001C7CF642|nr:SymE family type I addiction module toxin [Frischella sp. Ac48]
MHVIININIIQHGTKPKPQLTIKGRRLEQIGFYAGQSVIIKVEQDKLIIELAMQI